MKKHIIFLLTIAITAALTGCGSASNEVSSENAISGAAISEAEASIERSTSMEEIQEEAQEEAVQEESPEVEADSTVYGNTAGNIMGGGLFLEDDNYFYLYHGYDNCVYKTDKRTGMSDKLVDGYCLHEAFCQVLFRAIEQALISAAGNGAGKGA